MTRLFYHRLPDFARKEDKLDFLSANSLSTVDWRRLTPNSKHTWLRSDTEDEFDAYLPIGSKEAKRAKPDDAETIIQDLFWRRKDEPRQICLRLFLRLVIKSYATNR